MPAYHSSLTSPISIANMAMLPLRTRVKGPAPKTDDHDIIDETIGYFKFIFKHLVLNKNFFYCLKNKPTYFYQVVL